MFLYKIFNELRFKPKFKKKRVDSYIENRLSVFKNKYEKIIDVTIDKELQNFKNKANRYLIDQKNLEDFKLLRHTSLMPFDCIFKFFIKDIIFSIMINEDFNRPFIFRKLEKILDFRHKSKNVQFI